MDLVSVVTSQMSDSRSNELEASSSSQVTDYDSQINLSVQHQQQVKVDTIHTAITVASQQMKRTQQHTGHICAHATNSEGSKLNQNDNNSFSNILAAAIGHNYAPKDFSTFASNLCCQTNIMSTPDTENRNTNQGCFKSNHDVLWTGKVSDQCNDLSITSSEDSNHNNDSLQTKVHNYVKNENGSCCSFSPLLPSHTCHYNYHHDREEKSKMAFFSNLPEVAYNLVNTHSQTYGTEALHCVNFQQSVGDNSTSTQEDSSEGDCKSSKGSFVYIQKPSVNWPQVDRFYEIKPRLDHTPELNSKMACI
ncbi:unnamed protein product [Heterobilharzia americana]|nr:unnamed protein product [Heterobilharzia americana]